jgi:hypothetical protein
MMSGEDAGGGPPVPVPQVLVKHFPPTHWLPASGHEQITVWLQMLTVEPQASPAAAQASASDWLQTQVLPPTHT